MPELLKMGFEAEQGMIGAPSVLFGIVSYFGTFLSSVDCDYYRIQIEDQCSSAFGKKKQIGSQAVVQSDQSANYLWRQALQEPAQSGLVREMLQSQHFQKGSIVLQYFGLVDSPEPHNDGINQSQNQFGGMVDLVPLGKSNIILEMFFETKPFAKTLNQPHTTEVSDVCLVEGKINLLSPFGHWYNDVAQNTLLGKFVRWNLFDSYYSIFPQIIYCFHYFS